MGWAKKISYAMAAMYAVILGYIMLDAGKPDTLSWLRFAIPAWIWAVGPVACYSLYIAKWAKGRMIRFHTLLQMLFFVGSVYGYYDAFYVRVDAQSALTLIFFPIWQYVGLVAVVGVVHVVSAVIGKTAKH